jgi:insertion sequence IS232 putative ATP-binding protein
VFLGPSGVGKTHLATSIGIAAAKKSTILTTNMNFNEWDGVFYDAVVANAIMDRILHHAHVIPISGKSYRLKDHLKQTE